MLDQERTEMEEERDFLLASLDDLEREFAAGDIEEDDYRALHDDYTARAAQVIRRLDGTRAPDRATGRKAKGDPGAVATGPGATPVSKGKTQNAAAVRATRERDRVAPSARAHGRTVPARDAVAPITATPLPSSARPPVDRRRRPRALLGVVGVVVLAGLAGFLVMRSSGERRPNGTATGSITQGPTAQLDEAFKLYQQGRIVDALKGYDAVLRTDPNQVEALTYRGWLTFLVGTAATPPKQDFIDRAQAYLDKAVQADFNYADAHVFRGLVLENRGKPADAVCELRTYLGMNPPAERLADTQAALDRALREAGPTPPTCPQRVTPASTP